MSDFSKDEVREILSMSYGVNKEDINSEVVDYFANNKTNRLLNTMKKRGYDIPIREIIQDVGQGLSLEEISQKYNIKKPKLTQKIGEYRVIKNGVNIRYEKFNKVEEDWIL